MSKEREGRAYGGFSYGGMTGGVVSELPHDVRLLRALLRQPVAHPGRLRRRRGGGGHERHVGVPGQRGLRGQAQRRERHRGQLPARGIPAETAQVPGAHDMMTGGQLFTIYARDILWDADKDGVKDSSDVCADTVLPDAPSNGLKPNHYMATADGFVDAAGMVKRTRCSRSAGAPARRSSRRWAWARAC